MDLRFIYLIAVFLSTAELVVFFETSGRRTNKNFLSLFISSLVSIFGYTFSVFAPNLESSMCGIMISYLGSILVITFMLIIVIDLCEIHINNFLRAIIFLTSLFFVITVCSTQTSQLFYKNITLNKFHELTILDYTPGPILKYYVLYLIIINLSAVLIVLYSLQRKKQFSKKTLYILLGMILFGTLAYIIPLCINVRINLMVFVYIIMEVEFIILTIRANMYDLSSNLMEVYKMRGGYGYIAFDEKKHFLGCDEMAKTLFPCLKEVPIDSKIPAKYKQAVQKLNYDEKNGKWLDNLEKDFEINTDEMSAICTIHPLERHNKLLGYFFELRDNTKQKKYINNINHYNQELSKAVEEKTATIIAMQDSIIKGMAMIVESRDNSTGEHILRTSDCVRIFVQKLKQYPEFSQWCTDDFCENMIKAAPMHDLGKIAVDDSILKKPGKFNSEEYEQMKEHATKGSVIVQKILKETTDLDFQSIAINVAHYHHEKWDGTGYPTGTKENKIPMEARIMALSDVFDALVSKRCYKEAKSFDEAFSIIKNDLGKHFDPVIGKIFLECRPELEEYYKKAFKTDPTF